MTVYNKKKAYKKLENMWKEYCYTRDGKECMVKKYFPEINIMHSEVFQVDHCITRSCKWTFFMPENGTVVCSSCNMAKAFSNKSVGRAIDDIVIKREGQEKFDEMVAFDRSKKPNIDYKRIWWIEQQEEYLRERLRKLNEA